jgi:hypothetical protein
LSIVLDTLGLKYLYLLFWIKADFFNVYRDENFFLVVRHAELALVVGHEDGVVRTYELPGVDTEVTQSSAKVFKHTDHFIHCMGYIHLCDVIREEGY